MPSKPKIVNNGEVQQRLEEIGVPRDDLSNHNHVTAARNDTTVNPAARTPDARTKAADKAKQQRGIADGHDNADAAAKRIHSDPNDERSTMGESAHDTTVNPATAPRTPDAHTKAADEVKRQRDIANGYDNASRQSGVPRHSPRTSVLSPR